MVKANTSLGGLNWGPALTFTRQDLSRFVPLASVEDDGLGEELQVVWEVEPGAKVVEKIAVVAVSGEEAPVPLSRMVCVAKFGATVFRLLSVSTSDPEMGPAVVGAKPTVRVQFAPGASVCAAKVLDVNCGQVELLLSE